LHRRINYWSGDGGGGRSNTSQWSSTRAVNLNAWEAIRRTIIESTETIVGISRVGRIIVGAVVGAIVGTIVGTIVGGVVGAGTWAVVIVIWRITGFGGLSCGPRVRSIVVVAIVSSITSVETVSEIHSSLSGKNSEAQIECRQGQLNSSKERKVAYWLQRLQAMRSCCVNFKVASSLEISPVPFWEFAVRAMRLLTFKMPLAPHGDQTVAVVSTLSDLV